MINTTDTLVGLSKALDVYLKSGMEVSIGYFRNANHLSGKLLVANDVTFCGGANDYYQMPETILPWVDIKEMVGEGFGAERITQVAWAATPKWYR
jgi:hypothetical protein